MENGIFWINCVFGVKKPLTLTHTHTSINGDMNIPSAGEVGNITAGNGPDSAELGELHLMII